MYEKPHPTAARRSGDEFLRKMLSGDIPVGNMPAMEPSASIPTRDGNCCAGSAPSMPSRPSPCNHPALNPAMPALAMVYSPEQAWRCLYTPDKALNAGTLFAELDKPFEGRSIYRRAH